MLSSIETIYDLKAFLAEGPRRELSPTGAPDNSRAFTLSRLGRHFTLIAKLFPRQCLLLRWMYCIIYYQSTKAPVTRPTALWHAMRRISYIADMKDEEAARIISPLYFGVAWPLRQCQWAGLMIIERALQPGDDKIPAVIPLLGRCTTGRGAPCYPRHIMALPIWCLDLLRHHQPEQNKALAPQP